MKKVAAFVLVVLAINPASTWGETIMVPLPELTGVYIGWEPRNASFDLGTSLTYVGEVRIRLTGIFYPGTGHFFGENKSFVLSDSVNAIMEPPGSSIYWWGARTDDFNNVHTFSIERPFQWLCNWFYPCEYGEPSWDFLLDGQAEVTVGIGLYEAVPISLIVDEPSLAEIFEVYLIIEGPIKVCNPNGGEFIPLGSTYTIRWTDFRSGDPRDYFLKYSIDNGGNWISVESDSISNTCSYDWLIPSITSEQCLIRIVDANDPDVGDTSDNLFYIYQCQGPVAGDLNEDCYVDFRDFAIIAASWLAEGGTDMNDLSSFVQCWGDCGNPYDPACDN